MLIKRLLVWSQCKMFVVLEKNININILLVPPTPSVPLKYCYENNINYIGTNLPNQPVTNISSPLQCQLQCQMNPVCTFFVYQTYSRDCYLQNELINSVSEIGYVSGNRTCAGTIFECWFASDFVFFCE